MTFRNNTIALNFTALSWPHASLPFPACHKGKEAVRLTLQTPRVQATVLPREPQSSQRISASTCPLTLSPHSVPLPPAWGPSSQGTWGICMACCAESSQAETRISFSLI